MSKKTKAQIEQERMEILSTYAATFKGARAEEIATHLVDAAAYVVMTDRDYADPAVLEKSTAIGPGRVNDTRWRIWMGETITKLLERDLDWRWGGGVDEPPNHREGG